jgi:hypothetical protein
MAGWKFVFPKIDGHTSVELSRKRNARKNFRDSTNLKSMWATKWSQDVCVSLLII